ncbi:MAG TPA: gluconate 2-dehydrogenase subunit 3 family protein [Terracidiphilus sp.]|jgi:gluconate 2-dehydrogenase gamma chain|nr:gluconate 2-dehydrogenase subunit 3 family protein [Terracidiphilus sp.]
MTLDMVSRRAILKSLSMSVVAGSVLRVIPLEAAEYAHHMIDAEKADAPGGAYTPKFFDAHGYKTLQALCETIIPADADSGGANEGGAPEFIDLLTSENEEYQAKLGGGFKWLDATCTTRYGKAFLESTPDQQKEILDLIAYRKNAAQGEDVAKAIEFFSLLRNMAADGFFTSKVGIKYLGYKGNTYLTDFPGCPPVPGM